MQTRRVAVVVAIVSLSSCVSSRQARTVTPGTFLGPAASLLKKADKSEGVLLVYRKPDANWAAYDKIILEPTTIWSTNGTSLPAEDLADYQRLVDIFHNDLRAKLAKDYQLVDKPGPGTLRLTAAIVNGSQANNALKVVKTVAPYAGFADLLWTFVTGKPAFAGEVSLEFMIHDAQSDELLAAAADRRVGGNQLGKATFTTWGDVHNILNYWSELTVYRLCVDRAASGCQKPSAGITDRADSH